MTAATVSSIAGLTSTAATTSLGSSSAGSSALQIDSNQWLTLLTTQLKYQDPNSPTDPTQFVSQLAQFSMVSQQTQSNTTLGAISSQLTANSLGNAASMIGHTVSGTSGAYTVPSSGSPASASYAYSVSDTTLSNVHLQAVNASGTVVAQQSISGASGTATFNGQNGTGTALPAGSYTLSVVGTNTAGASVTAGTLTSSGKVTSALQNGDTLQYQLDNGSIVNASTITSVNET